MTTLQAIGFTLAGGGAVLATAYTAFTVAVYRRAVYIAPRATARPRNVIYHRGARPGHGQYRGNLLFGWILWVMRLDYTTLLRGVPGTGTRDGGVEGHLLRVTLDGIVLLRFHALGRKVSGVAAALCCLLLLPLYLSAPCLPDFYADDKYMELYECNSTALVAINHFRTTTLSHLPSLEQGSMGTAHSEYWSIRWRLYMAVIVLWIITAYCCHLLHKEWQELLALRRVYYLERRRRSSRAEDMDQSCNSLSSTRSRLSDWSMHRPDNADLDLEAVVRVRDPWIPHPEQAEVAPNIEPYSVLIGNLPSGAVDRQLSSLVHFFDHHLPHHPGFTSSVVAATVLPSATEIGHVWRHWYTAMAIMRRLDWIRTQIQCRRPLDTSSSHSAIMVADDDSDFGAAAEDELRHESDDFGPEQLAVYNRELAQSASTCGPRGCREHRVRRADLDELADWQESALMDLHQAQQELQSARRRLLAGDEYLHVEQAPSLELPEISPKVEVLKRAVSEVNGGDVDVSEESEASVKVRDLRDRRRWWKTMWEHIQGSEQWKRAGQCVESFSRESTYAVVTFTSRQAAAAAKQCLETESAKEGRIWMKPQDIPIPPLADAAPCTLLPFRYFCRPVTVSISEHRANLRYYLTLGGLGFFYIFYTVPLTVASSQVDRDTIAWLFPEQEWMKSYGINIPDLISGLTSSMIWSCFFMLCPQVFKMVAYYGSNATSMAQAERRALQYFWWFMVLTAFTGPMLAYWILGAVNKSHRLGDGLRDLLIRIAGATPTVIAANWLNWIIYRFTIILPINYLLQFNTFLFSFLGMKCCSRMTIGGGPGGPVPYRIYVDSGVVLMCTVALGPASPLVALAAFAYFLFCEPLLRRNLIFIYRPRYDDGGLRWIFVFDMVISSLVVGQILLALQMGLKSAFGPGLLATLAIPCTIWFQWYCKRKYDPAFENTALLKTSLLDGRETLDEMSMELRDEHRRFLVDAHKAAYVPACIAGAPGVHLITLEHARVVANSMIDSDHGIKLPVVTPEAPRRQSEVRVTMKRDNEDVTACLSDESAAGTVASWLDGEVAPLDRTLGLFRATAVPQKSE